MAVSTTTIYLFSPRLPCPPAHPAAVVHQKPFEAKIAPAVFHSSFGRCFIACCLQVLAATNAELKRWHWLEKPSPQSQMQL
jgi:hypothetical protein